MKKTFLFVIAFLLFFNNTSLARDINIATIERAPMSFKTENERWTGFSIDILNEISKDLNIQYSFKEYTVFDKMIKSVEDSKNDLAIANITITSERESRMDYSQPIFNSGLQVVVLKDNKKTSFIDVIFGAITKQ